MFWPAITFICEVIDHEDHRARDHST